MNKINFNYDLDFNHNKNDDENSFVDISDDLINSED